MTHSRPPTLCPHCVWMFEPPELVIQPGGSLEDFRAALETNYALVQAETAVHIATHAAATN
jgi:hypothetical protein